MLATVVETKELVSTVVAALLAAVGITLSYSLMILAAARFADHRRNDRPLTASAFAALAVAAFAITAAGIVIGLTVMTSKS